MKRSKRKRIAESIETGVNFVNIVHTKVAEEIPCLVAAQKPNTQN